MRKCRIGGCGREVPDHQFVCDRCYERCVREEAEEFECDC
jgi:hypothetical protein